MFKALTAALLICATNVYGQTSAEVTEYRRAIAEMRAGDWPTALTLAGRVGPVAHDIIEWHRLRSGGGSWDDATRFLGRRGDWPGLKLLRRKTEARLPIGRNADAVIDFFADQPPQTGHGARALIAAYRANGDIDAAEDLVVKVWCTELLSAEDEAALLSVYSDVLKDHHEERLDMLLWRDASQNAERMYSRVSQGWQALAKARQALRASDKGVDGLIAAVPASLMNHPGLAFERMQWRARKGRTEEALQVMLAATPETLGEPERWAGWRRAFARSEMRAGRTDRAYQLAARHGLTEGSHFADLEWLAGYLALTYKKDGKTALQHFLRFRGAVETPISLGRAGYWEGRAHELLGDAENAQLAYTFGAEYQTSFYGLLAAERAGLPMDPDLAGRADYPPLEQTSLHENSIFEAVKLFVAAGERNLAEQFVRHLAEHLPAADIGAMGDYVLGKGEPHLAVMIGKEAASRGIVVTRSYYPLASMGISHHPVPRELTLSIARRESEFDPVVISGAGARGLMQLMPTTAKAVAQDLDVAYSSDRLLTDPAYNARLGTAYLDELMAIFEGNVVMVSAGYNAGPGRPLRWMKQLGDPRSGEIDIVDWIEHVPFDETRNYIMRVAESLPVYRAQLSGITGPVRLTEEMISRPGHVRMALKGDFIRPRARPVILTD